MNLFLSPSNIHWCSKDERSKRSMLKILLLLV